jgi:hypothetical protein
VIHPLKENTMSQNGRFILAGAAVATAAIQVVADFNATHVFNPEWLPHARFHGIVGITAVTCWSITAIWLLWRPGSPRERDLGARIAALTSAFSWAPFFLAVALPGAGFEDTPGAVPRLVGIPGNMLSAALLTLVAAAGYALYRYEDYAQNALNAG